MKLITSIATILLFVATSNSQNLSGKAYYQSKTTVDMDGFGGREMSPEIKKNIMERMKSMLEKTYILTFNNEESIYKEEEKLEAGAGGGFGAMMSSFTPGEQYKNTKTKRIVTEQEFFGKQFLVIDTIADLKWEVGKESKQIGQYIAFKATATKAIDANDFSMARPKSGIRKNGGDVKKDSVAEKSDDPMDNIEIPKEILVTAWFTPQIPVKNGPGEYAGLPGLILELNFYKTTILCSKIVMNPKDTERIEAPTKGKEVSQAEYNKIVKEKMDEIRENFRGRGRGRN